VHAVRIDSDTAAELVACELNPHFSPGGPVGSSNTRIDKWLA
jgi:hypothetical protein